jgi:signal transduction histidine kinase
MRTVSGRIEKQINWLIAIPCIVLFTALTSYFLSQRLANAEDQLERRGHLIASQLAPLTEYSLFSGDFSPLESSFQQLLQDPEIVAIEVFDHAGTRLFRRTDPHGIQDKTRSFDALVRPSVTAVNESAATPGSVLGKVRVYMSTVPLQKEQVEIIRSGALIAALVLLVSLLGAMWYGRRLSSRIVELAEAVRSLKNGDYDVRMEAKGYSELEQLARDVQSLAQTLKQAEMTEKQYVQALLKSVREAQEANAAKSEFLANISHELRTPMNATLGMLQLLTIAELPETEKEQVELALQSTQHLLTLINDILDFEKAQGGRIRLERIRVQIHDMLTAIAASFQPQARGKSLPLKTDMDSLQGQTILTDPTRLTQIVTNLLGNAIKFTDTGQVELHAHLEPASNGSGDERRLIVRVKDTGPGIPEHLHSHIFEAFTQADASTTRRYGGTGLGLAITRQLTQLFDGHISIESEPGKGSVFTVMIPVRMAPATSHIEASQEPAASIPRLDGRVLLAEDNPANQKVASTMLRKLGLRVEIASDGDEALKLATIHNFDLLAIDLQMPGMDGLRLLDALRRDSGLNQTTPAVIISAAETNLSEDDKRHLRVIGSIPKPIRFDHLVSIAAMVLPQGTQGD